MPSILDCATSQTCRVTVSIGVGDNLPYAKIGSDLASNNEVCELWNEEREEKVYLLPVSDLLYVGPATTDRFKKYGINTIVDLARSTPEYVRQILRNKTGESLWTMAVGQDKTPVACIESVSVIKSIGNSNTIPRDLVNNNDVRAAFYMLGESISERMRENGSEATTHKISVRDNELLSFERQAKLPRPTNLTAELVPAAMELFKRSYGWYKEYIPVTLDVFPDGVYELVYFWVHGSRYMIEKTSDIEYRGSFYAGGVGVLHKVDARLVGADDDEDPDPNMSVIRVAALYLELNKWFVCVAKPA